MFWRFEKRIPSLSRNMVGKLGVGLSVLLSLDKDSLHSECEKSQVPNKTLSLLNDCSVPNTSRM